jgi:hypothetical protein
MRRWALLALVTAGLLAGTASSAQDFVTYLGAASGSRAKALVAAVDGASASLAKGRAGIREAMLKEEARALVCYALDSASRNGDNWASPDGALTGSRAAEGFVSGRTNALADAEALSSSTWTADGRFGQDLIGAREAAAAKLDALLRSASPSERASAGLEKLLSTDGGLARLFPEAAELGKALLKAGPSGRVIWLGALSRRVPAEIAGHLAASRSEIEAASPASRDSLERLENAVSAYRALIAAMPVASYLAELPISPLNRADSLGHAIIALLDLPGARAMSLIAAMERGDPLESASALAARRFASIWNSLPAVRRAMLQRIAFVSASSMARFSSLAAPPMAAAAAEPAPGSLAERALALNELSARLFALQSEPMDEVRAQTREPGLVLLERPDLAALAFSESRYANLDGDVRLRLGRLYHEADEAARKSIARDPRVAKAAERALGAKASSLVVETSELQVPEAELGRRLMFVVRATTDAGATLIFPAAVEVSAPAYAAAFARAASVEAAGSSSELLARYGQRVLCALPLDGGGSFVLACLPRGAERLSNDYAEAETRLLEGWKP